MTTHFMSLPSRDEHFEIIERKGLGHPDTLADHLAEACSRAFSLYTLEHFGAILHHNFDKIGLLGGRSSVRFGRGRLVSPIRVLLNGRATESVGDAFLPVRPLLIDCARTFLRSRLPKIDPNRDIILHDNLSSASSPGHVETSFRNQADRASWFRPGGLHDVRELRSPCSNDTSVGCAHWPPSPTECLVSRIEFTLTEQSFLAERPWLGTDIKVMACRVESRLDLTLCVPQIADHVQNAEEYRSHLDGIRETVSALVRASGVATEFTISLNTKDDFEIPELYLTAIGSSIESGDEGLVGRGNRPNGLIAMCRPYSMEGACGKNPVYHVGKLYGIAASRAAKALHETYGGRFEVWLTSQEGRLLADPWQIVVRADVQGLEKQAVIRVVMEVMDRLPELTREILSGDVILA